MWAILRESPPDERLKVALVGAAAVGFPALAVGGMLLSNTQGPFPAEDRRLLAPVVFAVAWAVVGYAAAWVLLWFSRTLALLGLVAYVVVAWTLFPTSLDGHQECRGYQFSHYPPGVSDGNTTDLCVGLESP